MLAPSENIILQSGDLSRVDERESGQGRSEKNDMGIIAKHHESPVWMDYIGLSISSTFEHFSKQ